MTTIDNGAPGQFTPEQLLLTIVEAAKMLRISRTTIYALMGAGESRQFTLAEPAGSPSLRYAASLPCAMRRPIPRFSPSISTRTNPPLDWSSVMGTRIANGESSIFRGKDGRWHGYVSVGTDANGKRDRRHVTGKSRAVVVDKVRGVERDRDAGTLSTAQIPTLAEWLSHWLENIASRRVRPRTLESYESIIRRHVLPTLGTVKLDRLQPEHLERLYKQMVDQGLSSTTALRVHRILARALKVAHQRGRVNRNVASLVDAPTTARSDVAHALTPEECRAVLRAARSDRNTARWTVALALGLRQSEALALGWGDIDLLERTLLVRRTLHRVSGVGLVFEEPKTYRSRRKLALPATLAAQLSKHKLVQAGERMLAGSEWHDSDLVFTRPNGLPIDKKTDYDQWCRLLRQAGVRHIRLHDARHTAATLLLTEGVHPRVVMELLGHSQMRTTMDIYSHVMPPLATEAARRMDAVLGTDDEAEIIELDEHRIAELEHGQD